MTEDVQENQSMDIVEQFNALSKKKKAKVCTVASLLVILIVTVLCYLPTLKNDFVYYDDDRHLIDNPSVRGLDAGHLKQMFTMPVNQIYIPLTLLTYAVEHHFYKYDPFIYHLDNLLLHLGITALAFWLALKLGLSLWATFIAVLLFSVHPMRVESVSWVTERKDVLYAFFYMCSLCMYWKYLNEKKITSYAASVVFGTLSILAKPMALSLPLVLFIFDWFKGRKFDRTMIIDKIPHFLYAVGIAFITYRLNARVPGESVGSGIVIWAWTFVFYLRQFFLPLALVPLYALPEPFSVTNPEYAATLGLTILIAVCMVRCWRVRWLTFAGAFYFLSVFFLLRYDIQVDKGIVADRFMYLPCLGICFALGHGVDFIFKKSGGGKTFLGITTVVVFLLVTGLLGIKTFTQTQIWRASIPFWSHVIRYYPDNAMAYGNRGEAYKDQKKYDLAMRDFHTSIIADPGYVESYNSRGQMYGMMGDSDSALEDFMKVIELSPNFDEAYNNIGVIYSMQEKPEEALEYYEKAVEIDTFNIDARINAGEYYYKEGEFDKALGHFQRIIEINPASALAYNKRGLIYGIKKDYDLSLKDINRALTLQPNNSEFHKDKGIILEHKKMLEEAIDSHNKAIEINPEFADAYCFRGNALAQLRQYGDAAKDFAKALEIDPDHWRAKQSQNALIKVLTGRENDDLNIREVINEEQEKRMRMDGVTEGMEDIKGEAAEDEK